MIILRDVTLNYGSRILFNKISMHIPIENKIGLVGLNGAGKSTLLKAVAKEINLDGGEILVSKGVKIGYVPQEIILTSDKNIFSETFSSFAQINQLQAELAFCEKELSLETNSPQLLEKYSSLQEKLKDHDVSKAIFNTEKILTGLGFLKSDFEKPVNSLSVGWKMRIVLAKLLLMEADFYLFDEPTNHLDILAKDWLCSFLKKANFGFLLVCHDRYFLDHLCTQILELENGEGVVYQGNFTEYLSQKERNDKILEQQKKVQDDEIARQLKTAERFRSGTKAKMAQAIFAKIEKIERIELRKNQKKVNIRFPEPVKAGKVVLTVKKLANRFNEKQIFKDVSFEIKNGEKVGIIASNGVGKTTLLNLIMGKLKIQEGSVDFGYNVIPGYFEQEQSLCLNKNKTIFEEVIESCKTGSAEAVARSFLGAFLFSGDDIYKKISMLSGGEKNRVAMVKVLMQQANFLILDEPTNHLDIQSIQVLLKALQQFPGTILFVSHDRDFLDKLATQILELTPTHMVSYEGNYEAYVYHREILAKEQNSPKETNATLTTKQPTSDKKNKTLAEEQKLKKLEGLINLLEVKIRKLQDELNVYEFESDRYNMTISKIEKSKKELNLAIEEWEAIEDV